VKGDKIVLRLFEDFLWLVFLAGGLAALGVFVVCHAAHAEPMEPGDVIIKDRSDYEMCLNAENRPAPAKPPYYIILLCINFHNPQLPQTQCHNFMRMSFCSMDDCHKKIPQLPPFPQGRVTETYVCATVNGGEYELEPLNDPQEPSP
jgi:hypothetical protein